MDNTTFYSIYIPALEEALENDHIDYGFHVKGPDFYIDKKYLIDVDSYIQNSGDNEDFFNRIAYYFDAISHNFPNILGVTLYTYKKNILENIESLKQKYNLNSGNT